MCGECASLGCGIGYGYLHRIPTRSTESTSPKAFPPSGGSSPVKAPLPGTGFNEVTLLLLALQWQSCSIRQSKLSLSSRRGRWIEYHPAWLELRWAHLPVLGGG